MDFYKNFPQYKIKGDIDNQIGHLHNKLQYYDPYKKGFEMKLHDETYQNVFITKDIIPKKLAEKVRKFINDIPFDNTLKILNDDNNQPRESISKSLNDSDKIKIAYENKRYNPHDWIWEKYDNDFWRVLPLSLEAFCGSPIIKLIEILERRWYQTKINNFDITKYRKATWVIQRIEKGHGIGLHTDDNPWRKLAFVYYLTSDDWNYKNDGGELCVCNNNYDEHINPKEYISINPEFNTMITWEMLNQKGPLHFVNNVEAENEKPRIALVGFFVE